MLKDLTGQRFGRLIVLSLAPRRVTSSGATRTMWNVRCDCGGEKAVEAASLRSANTRSCGCLEIENRSTSNTVHGAARQGRNTPEYKAWLQMRQRCYQPTAVRYARYGGRGIKVCDRWRNDFAAFLADIGAKPSPKHSVDRIDSNADYTPENCRWATAKEQARNKSTTKFLTLNGETRCMVEWAERLGWTYSTLLHRVQNGWSDERALTQQPRRPRKRKAA